MSLDSYTRDLIAIARDARIERKPRETIEPIEAEINARIGATITRYDCTVIASDHCYSDYLQYGPSDERLILMASPRVNGSTLDQLIEDMHEEFSACDMGTPSDLPWSEIEAALREHYRADARFMPVGGNGNDHECSDDCDGTNPGNADHACPFNSNHEQPNVYAVVRYVPTDEWTEARDQFLAGHRQACLWANCSAYVERNDMPEGEEREETIESDEDGGSLDRPEDLSDDDLDDSAREALDSDASDFFASEADLLVRAVAEYDQEWSQLGHDFALTRAGHGAGFWDRGTGEVGEALTKACKPYGNVGIMVPLIRDEDGNLIGPERALTSGDIHS